MSARSSVFQPSVFDVRKVMRGRDFNRKTGLVTRKGWKRLTAEALKAHDAMLRRMIRFQKLGMPLLVAVEPRDFQGRPRLNQPVVYGCYEGPHEENLLLSTGADSKSKQGISWAHVARIQILDPLHVAEGLNKIFESRVYRSILEFS